MKIGIEAQRIFRKKKHGMDIYVLELIRSLQAVDNQNQYVVFVKPDEDVCLKASENLKIVEVKGATYFDWEQISLPKAIEKEQVDIMHFTSNTAPLHKNVPYVLTVHDIIYMKSFTGGGSLYQTAGHYYRCWNVPKVATKAAYVLTVSEYEKLQIAKTFTLTSYKLQAVYNGYSQQFKVATDAVHLASIREKYTLPQRFLLFLGNQAPKKNMKRVLKAYQLYTRNEANPIPLVIAETSRGQLLKMLAKLNCIELLGKIVLTGYIPHTDLPFIYQLAEVFLYPSLQESFGIPIIEAMACGTPVITSKTTAMPEVANGAAYLVNPENETELYEAISQVVGSVNQQAKWRNKGFERAADFSWENTAKSTLSLYKKVVEENK